MKTALCIPTLNAQATAHEFLSLLDRQTFKIDKLLVIDSDSDDGSPSIFRNAGAEVFSIPRSSFNHGATRQLAVELCPDADIMIFMTQDSFLAFPEAIKNLLTAFDDEKVGAACGRQLPKPDASPIVAHARLFNYPPVSALKTSDDIVDIGVKAAFMSDSFAAYRRDVLVAIGGFPKDVIVGEDAYVAAKMLLEGWSILYCATAAVYHSHNYGMFLELKRYFDTGVFHSREKWFLEALGKAEGEGKRFVISEFRYLLKNSLWHIPSALLRNCLKYSGYRLGCMERRIPGDIKKKLSMHKDYWK